jgi:pilus assembly protein Flp/PilA
MNILNRFVRDESGATAIEYSLIAALMAVALIAAVPTLGNAISTSFTNIATQLTSVPAAGGGGGG